VALVKSACDSVLPAHGEVKIAARWLHDLINELPKNLAPRTIELPAVENLMKHDRASGYLHVAHAGSFPVPLECDNYAVLVNALPGFDAAFESVLPNVREYVVVGLKTSVDRLEIAETCVSHGYRFLKT
jgi:hypothetical protein